jgi:hypothetical protein
MDKLVGKENDDRVALLKLRWASFKIATTNERPTYELKKSSSTVSVQLNGEQFTNFIS